jgi:hypothetical protein
MARLVKVDDDNYLSYDGGQKAPADDAIQNDEHKISKEASTVTIMDGLDQTEKEFKVRIFNIMDFLDDNCDQTL